MTKLCLLSVILLVYILFDKNFKVCAIILGRESAIAEILIAVFCTTKMAGEHYCNKVF